MSSRPPGSGHENPEQAPFAAVEALLRSASCRRLLFITGAGLSADSGLPTYRGTGGLYNESDTEEGVSIEEALSGRMLRVNPALCWKYIAQIESGCRGAAPNAGHRAIAALEADYEVCVLTQNVDGFHRKAGSSHVIDIHGDVHTLHCTACLYQAQVVDYSHLTLPPSCPRCGALVRPEVVLFGEMLPTEKLSDLESALQRGFDMVFSVGTTSVFQYIAAPVWHARQSGVPTVEINPGKSEVSGIVDFRFSSGAADTLSRLVEGLRKPS